MTERDVLAKIRDYMSKNNLRQWELAKKLGVPDGTLNRWLREKSNISKAYLKLLEKEGVI
jgi:transcriptional regulator with XRE-family HTH domain